MAASVRTETAKAGTALTGPWARRGLLLVTAIAAVTLANAAGNVLPVKGLDVELALLVEVMIYLKATVALVAFGLLWWRLGQPIGHLALTGALGLVAIFSAAPVMISNGTLIMATSVVFHAALFLGAYMALNDDAAFSLPGRGSRPEG
ncbi:MAG: hypothetical protein EA356_06240 [Geminicoccaceae bacterium]|nr:MAG: hypothetical protein EA356_06240 [Geminicoccaceae bacterium]